MKCEAMVRREEYGKKGKIRISHIFSMWHIVVQRFSMNGSGHDRYNKYKESEFKRCKGNIKATVSIEIDDGCSCCGHTHIQIDYECDTCKNTCFYELPQDEKELSKSLTDHVASMSRIERSEILNKKLNEEIKREKVIESFLKKEIK